MNNEGWMMKDDDFKLLRGFGCRQTDRLGESRVAFATENLVYMEIMETFSYQSMQKSRSIFWLLKRAMLP